MRNKIVEKLDDADTSFRECIQSAKSGWHNFGYLLNSLHIVYMLFLLCLHQTHGMLLKGGSK